MAGAAGDGDVIVESGGGIGRKRKSRCGRTCFIITIVCLAIIIFILFLLLLHFIIVSLRSGPAICTTSECLMAAAVMKSRMNQSVDPCTDFYKFACGQFIAKNPVPQGKIRESILDRLGEQVKSRIREILTSNSPVSNSDVNKMLSKARKVYRKCLESELLGSSKSILQRLFAKVGPLPVLNRTIWGTMSNANFMGLLVNASAFDVPLFFNARKSFDLRNTSIYTIWLYEADQSPFLMRKNDFKADPDSKKRKAYTKLLKDVLEKVYADFGFPSETVNAEAIVELQAKIMQNTQTRLMRRNETLYSRMTIQDLIDSKPTWNKFDWRAYFEALGKFSDNEAVSNLNRNITITGLDYLKKTDDLFKESPDVTKMMGQVLTFELVMRFMQHLRVDYRDMHEKFNKDSSGLFNYFSREQVCRDYVLNVYYNLVARVYSEKYFDTAAKKSAESMIEKIRSAFDAGLAKLAWLDEKTRKRARKKLAMMVQNTGFDPKALADSSFEDDSNPSFEDFINGMIAVYVKNGKKTFHGIESPINRTSLYYIPPLMVNAMFRKETNTIEFPMAILTAQLFNKKHPSAMNFGGIGSIIGHEILHAFDNNGSKRDKTGNLRQWWTPSVRAKFNKKTQCIVDQYANYKSPYGKNLRGRLTLGENIADQAGMKYAYLAFQKEMADGLASEGSFPGLPYSANQMFFINFAQMYCASINKRYWETKALSSVHTVPEFRVFGVLSTSSSFHKAFKCKKGDKMYAPACPMW